MNLGPLFQRLALYRASRRVPLWVLVALSVGFYLLAGIGEAHADTTSNTAGEAHALCVASGQNYVSKASGSGKAYKCDYLSNAQVGGTILVNGQSLPRADYKCTGTSNNWTNSSNCSIYAGGHLHHYFPDQVCASGSHWDATLKQCVDDGPSPEECAAKTPITNMWGEADTICDGGCKYEAWSGGVSVGLVNPDGTEKWFPKEWTPTGDTCTVGPAGHITTKAQECIPQGNLTQCVKPSGLVCATASTGRQICWNPGETGTKTDGPVAQVRTAGTSAGDPPTPPAGETFTQTGGPATTTIRARDGGSGTVTNITTTTTNYTTTNGTNAGGGTGGTGEPGDGSGGDGDEGDGAGSPGDGVGDVYEGTDKTIASVYATFQTNISEAPLIAAANGFFGGCSGGGSCPSEVWVAPDYGISFDLTEFCTGVLAGILALAGWVFLAGVAFFGWKVAFL